MGFSRLFYYMSASRWFAEFGDWLTFLLLIVLLEKPQYISFLIIIQNVFPIFISPFIGNFVESRRPVNIALVAEIVILCNTSLIYVAYIYQKYKYLVYAQVFIHTIAFNIKNTCFSTLMPTLTQEVEKANKIHCIAQSFIYIFSMSLGGIILNYLGGVANLVINNVFLVASIIFIFILQKNLEISVMTVDRDIQEKIAFADGLIYLRANTKFVVLILINSIIYYIYGVIEIINYRLGFQEYNILILSLVLGFSTSGIFILYFYDIIRLYPYYFILVASCVGYYFVETRHSIPLWMFSLWFFSFMHYAFWIKINSILQIQVAENFRARVLSYNFGLVYFFYGIGSLSASFFQPHYWILVLILCLLAGILLVCYEKLVKLEVNVGGGVSGGPMSP